jgi:hypothetical protein
LLSFCLIGFVVPSVLTSTRSLLINFSGQFLPFPTCSHILMHFFCAADFSLWWWRKETPNFYRSTN